MKIMLVKDVYKLGRAGDVKKVADGYGRNYLIPQGLAVLATPGALKKAELIRTQADVERAALNQEMGAVAESLSDLTVNFPVKAGETGKLYGSVTSAMIADAINEETGIEISRRQMDMEPIRNLGVHKVEIRLTIDLIPEITVVVYREGESPEQVLTSEQLEISAEAVEEIEVVETEMTDVMAEEVFEEEPELVASEELGDSTPESDTKD